ncbi:hypothetical protein BS47DRAFT_1369694 [Hydnum rufescens UP504]|uniref:Uncharacterized protein n=1 Tax=Hydnum rufescens UP504 TaxID=1448309 RepID=A0A9P6DG70_9AGAM|nr:hypothetical protein BS47DRAFT_1369694 [Hydnum rufescens UP504]
MPSLTNMPALEGELERLYDSLEAAQSHRSPTSGGSPIERRNEELEATLEDAQEAVTDRDQLIERLGDAKATLRLERSESRAKSLRNEKSGNSWEKYVFVTSDLLSPATSLTLTCEGNDALRDRLVAMTIALDQKESDLQALSEVHQIEDWKTEVSEECAKAEELQDSEVISFILGIVERETQVKELQLRINELESNQAELHGELEKIEQDNQDVEIESANREIERLSARVWGLEEELERTTDRLECELGERVSNRNSPKPKPSAANCEIAIVTPGVKHESTVPEPTTLLCEWTRTWTRRHPRVLLEMELGGLKKDLACREDELDRARNDVKDRECVGQERETLLNNDKSDILHGNVKQAETDLATARVRVTQVEQKLNEDQRSILATENQYIDQLTKRNTLLLTIYQHMDKILAVDKALVRYLLIVDKEKGAAEMKPFMNFGTLHDDLINRLKALSQIQLDFRSSNNGIGNEAYRWPCKQLDFRWRQINRFETRVKNLGEVKNSGRWRYDIKEGDLKAKVQIFSIFPFSGSQIDADSRATQTEQLATVAQNHGRRVIGLFCGQGTPRHSHSYRCEKYGRFASPTRIQCLVHSCMANVTLRTAAAYLETYSRTWRYGGPFSTQIISQSREGYAKGNGLGVEAVVDLEGGLSAVIAERPLPYRGVKDRTKRE